MGVGVDVSVGVFVGVDVFVGVEVGVNVGVGVYVAVAVGVRVIFTTSTCETASGSPEEKARDIVGVPYQVRNIATTTNRTKIRDMTGTPISDFVLVIELAEGCSTMIWFLLEG